MVTKLCVKIRFKRYEGSTWEEGIGIGNDTGDLDTIIDRFGKPVPGPIWEFKDLMHEGLIRFNIA